MRVPEEHRRDPQKALGKMVHVTQATIADYEVAMYPIPATTQEALITKLRESSSPGAGHLEERIVAVVTWVGEHEGCTRGDLVSKFGSNDLTRHAIEAAVIRERIRERERTLTRAHGPAVGARGLYRVPEPAAEMGHQDAPAPPDPSGAGPERDAGAHERAPAPGRPEAQALWRPGHSPQAKARARKQAQMSASVLALIYLDPGITRKGILGRLGEGATVKGAIDDLWARDQAHWARSERPDVRGRTRVRSGLHPGPAPAPTGSGAAAADWPEDGPMSPAELHGRRVQAGLNRTELARRIEAPYNWFRRWEAGQKPIPPDRARAIRRATAPPLATVPAPGPPGPARQGSSDG